MENTPGWLAIWCPVWRFWWHFTWICTDRGAHAKLSTSAWFKNKKVKSILYSICYKKQHSLTTDASANFRTIKITKPRPPECYISSAVSQSFQSSSKYHKGPVSVAKMFPVQTRHRLRSRAWPAAELASARPQGGGQQQLQTHHPTPPINNLTQQTQAHQSTYT